MVCHPPLADYGVNMNSILFYTPKVSIKGSALKKTEEVYYMETLHKKISHMPHGNLFIYSIK